MKDFSFKITISATSEEEAKRKMQAGAALFRNLNVKEMEKLADIVQHDPVKTAMAKKALGM